MPYKIIRYTRQLPFLPLEPQNAAMDEWMATRNCTLVAEYTDRQVGDVDTGLPGQELTSMLIECRNQDIVLVYDTHKVFQTPDMLLEVELRLGKHGAKLLSLTGKGKFDSDLQNTLYDLYKANYHYRMAFRKEMARCKLRMHQQAGRPINNQPPYGWKITFKNRQWVLEPDNKEQELIAFIVQKHEDGFNTAEVTRMLKHEGFKSRKGKELLYNQVRRIIKQHWDGSVPNVDEFVRRENRLDQGTEPDNSDPTSQEFED